MHNLKAEITIAAMFTRKMFPVFFDLWLKKQVFFVPNVEDLRIAIKHRRKLS